VKLGNKQNKLISERRVTQIFKVSFYTHYITLRVQMHCKIAAWSSAGQEVNGGTVILTNNNKIMCATCSEPSPYLKSLNTLCGAGGSVRSRT